MKTSHFLLLSLMVALVLLGEAPMSMAVTCNPTALTACASAILTGAPPSGACCSKLSQQRPCLCSYLKDPRLQKYINAGSSRRVAAACKVPAPKC